MPNEGKTLDQELHLDRYWNIIRPRLSVLVACLALAIGGGALKILTSTPMYRASGIIMIAPESEGAIAFNERYSVQRPDMEYFNTQVRILQSRTLARRVLEELNTDGFLRLPGAARGADNLDLDAGMEMARRIGQFLASLDVAPIRDTRLVEVSCTSANAERATTIVNTLFQKYIDFNRELKSRSTQQTSIFIEQQMNSLRENLARKEEELQNYGKKKDLFFLSNDENVEVGKFSDLNRAYTDAQIQRIAREALYRELRDKPWQDFPEVRTNTVVTQLKSQFSTLEADYKRRSQVFKDSYPEMVQLRSQMEALQKRLEEETRDVAEKSLSAARTEYESALNREQSMAKLLETQKKDMEGSNSDAIYYKSLGIEVANMRELQNFLDRKHKEALLSSNGEGSSISNIRIIDPADVPRRQVSPNPQMIAAMSLVAGLSLGLMLVFFLHLMDRSVKTPEDIQQVMDAPTLGLIPAGSARRHYSAYFQYLPMSKRKNELPRAKDVELSNLRDPESPLAESFRNIRTSLMLSTAGKPPRIIAVSSARPEEGKTSTVVNLAVAFQQLGKKVLIIDGDMRKPRIHKIFRLKNTVGLSTWLVGRTPFEKIVFKTEAPDLWVIGSGPTPPNPVELLNSDLMASLLTLESVDFFDMIFIDCPPFVEIMDPVLLGKLADGLLLVTWSGKTSRSVLAKAKEQIDRFRIHFLGVILNKVDLKTEGYGYSYNYKTPSATARSQARFEPSFGEEATPEGSEAPLTVVFIPPVGGNNAPENPDRQ